MSNVGYATLSIIPSARGFEKALKGQTSPALKAAGSAAGTETSKSFMSTFSSQTVAGLDKFGGTIVSTASRWAGRGAVAAGAVVAGGLWGGLQRALDREDAIVTFKRMGLSESNIDQLTGAINDTLAGTPISNPEGFQLAGRFLAQGFEEADIPDMVSTLADMSKVGNRSFQEMADVMVAAAGAGKVTAAELQRMGDIPLGQVAAALGMTEGQMRDLASTGGLSAEMFMEGFAAIESFSGAAKDATTRVAFSNLRTAISSLGEQFLAPWLGENGPAQRGLLALRERLSALGPSVKVAGERFAQWLIPAVQSAAGFFENRLVPAIQHVVGRGRDLVKFARDNEGQIRKLLKAIVPAAGAIAGLAVSVNLGIKAFKILKTATPIGILLALTTGLVYAYQNSERFREVVDRALGWVTTNVLPALRAAFEWVVSWFQANWPQIQAAIAATVDWLQANVLPVVEAVIGWLIEQFQAAVAYVQDYWPQIQQTIAGVIEAVKIVIETTVTVIRKIWAKWGDQILALVSTTWENIKTVIQAAIDIVRGIIDTVTSLIRGDWQGVWDGIKTILSGAWELIKAIVSQGLEYLKLLLQVGWDLVKLGAQLAWDGIKALLGLAWDGIKELVAAGVGWVRDKLADIWEAITSKVGEVWEGIKTTVSDLIDEVIGFVQGIPGRMLEWAAAIGSAALEIGSSIINGVWDGLGDLAQFGIDLIAKIVEGIKAAAGQITSAIKDAVPSPGDLVGGVVSGIKGGVKSVIPGLASGGFAGPGWTGWVGEEGPELMAVTHSGAHVADTRASQQIVRRSRPEVGRNAPLMTIGEQHIHNDVDADALFRGVNALERIA